jgi:hypothetical protein
VDQILHRRTQRRQQRCAHACRQQTAGISQPFGHDLALPVRITAAVEYDLDRRQALARGRAYGRDVFGAGQQTFKRARDERLDLGRVEPGRFGLHQHVWRREIRKHIEARIEQRGDAEHADQHRQRRDDTRIAE